MGLLSKLKSLLGFGDDRPARRGNVDVTVEHEPGESADAESERAVKEPATEPEPTVEETAEPDSDPEVEPEPDSEPEPEPTVDETETEAAETTDDAESDGEPTVEEEVVEEAEPAQTGAAAESVDTIKGIGPSYAEKLSSAGVETVGDLASADADALGDETGLSPKRIGGWIEQAEARTQ